MTLQNLKIPENANLLTKAEATVAIIHIEKKKDTVEEVVEGAEGETTPTDAATADAEKK